MGFPAYCLSMPKHLGLTKACKKWPGHEHERKVHMELSETAQKAMVQTTPGVQ